MGAKIQTPISTLRKLRLVLLAIFKPVEFQKEEEADNKQLEVASPDTSTRVQTIRKAYFESFLLVVSAVAVGLFIARLGQMAFAQSQLWITVLAILGTALLLWATVANRGWEIASFATKTLGERLNVWVFRTYYWVGTMCLVAAATGSGLFSGPV
jgi:hypothetical protein